MVVVGRNHNPSILNPDFLKINGIVPADWELAQPPFCTEMISQVAYKNGVVIVSQQGKIVFTEPFAMDGSGSVEVPGVAREYLRNVPHVAYQAVGVNPKGHVEFDSDDAALQCMRRTFLAQGPWLEYGQGVRKTGVRFGYDLEGRILNLTIDTARLPVGDESKSVIVFAGNFHHQLGGEATKDLLESALKEVEKWEADVKEFRTLVTAEIFGGEA